MEVLGKQLLRRWLQHAPGSYSTSLLPWKEQKWAFVLESHLRELQGAVGEALIKSGSCPLSPLCFFHPRLISYYWLMFHFLLLFNKS